MAAEGSRHVRAIGVMSGTSCDGADAVLLDIEDPDARHEPKVLAHAFVPYPETLRRELLAPDELSLPRVAELEHELPALYEEVVRKLPDWQSAEVVGCHGQTVWHGPPSSGVATPHTLQLGSPGALAVRLGLVVVGDFRAADLALGGEGAPIAPLAHYLFTPESRAGRLVVNVGGIANVTYVPARREDVRAGDVGPGNMIADRLCHEMTDGAEAYDRDGTLSAPGTVDEAVVEHVLSHPFFERPAPRSTGREDFGFDYTEALMRRFAALSPATLLQSVLAATAACIVRGAADYSPKELLITGGGAKNPTLMALITERAGDVPVFFAEDGPFAPSVHEPAAMALIAARTLRGLPSNLPAVTGASRPAVLGVVARPAP